jgi:tRNA (guanine-N7-)-methyltransferase
MPDSAAHPSRAIRSFVKRGGRTTPAQARAIAELWPRFGVEPGPTALEFTQLFGRRAPAVLEIGFGDGEALVSRAASAPERDFLGLEVHPPGVGHCLLLAEAAELGNLRILSQDAVEVLGARLAPASLDEVLIWFPDPWPKKRHHKRRLVNEGFASLLATRLRPGGVLRFASDWQPYADEVLAVLNAHADFVNAAADGGFVARPAERIVTKFERRGLRLGHRVSDLMFNRR